jgi:hypothetical protein
MMIDFFVLVLLVGKQESVRLDQILLRIMMYRLTNIFPDCETKSWVSSSKTHDRSKLYDFETCLARSG